MDRNSRAALDLYRQAERLKAEGKLPASHGIAEVPARVRLASQVDLSKHDPDCERCDGGVVRYEVVDDDRVPVVCRCVSRNGGVERDAFDKATGANDSKPNRRTRRATAAQRRRARRDN